MTALDAYLLDTQPEPEGEEERAAWSIRSLGEADWAMRKLTALRARQTAAREEAARQRALIDEWEAAEVGRHEQSADFFEFHLRCWWAVQLDATLTAEHGLVVGEPGWEKAWEKLPSKSQVLPCGGKVTARKEQPEWTFDDIFVAWAREQRPELVETKYSAKKVDAKKAFANAVRRDDGTIIDGDEIIPGVTVIPGLVTIKAEPAS